MPLFVSGIVAVVDVTTPSVNAAVKANQYRCNVKFVGCRGVDSLFTGKDAMVCYSVPSI